VIAVQAAGIEKNVILHGRAAETGIVGNAGHTAISALMIQSSMVEFPESGRDFR
jgi:hypothetical protein